MPDLSTLILLLAAVLPLMALLIVAQHHANLRRGRHSRWYFTHQALMNTQERAHG